MQSVFTLGVKPDSDTAQFHQPGMFLLSIGARDVEEKVAVRFHPEVYANLAVT